MDWNALGTAIGGLALGAGGVGLWWRKQAVEGAASSAQVSAYDLMRQELERLASRVGALEQREGRLIRHVYRLEAVIRSMGHEPPAFDIESDTLKAGD